MNYCVDVFVCRLSQLLLLLVSWETRGFELAMVYMIPLCVNNVYTFFSVYVRLCVCVRTRDRKDEEKEQPDPVFIDCWTWLYSKSMSL